MFVWYQQIINTCINVLIHNEFIKLHNLASFIALLKILLKSVKILKGWNSKQCSNSLDFKTFLKVRIFNWVVDCYWKKLEWHLNEKKRVYKVTLRCKRVQWAIKTYIKHKMNSMYWWKLLFALAGLGAPLPRLNFSQIYAGFLEILAKLYVGNCNLVHFRTISPTQHISWHTRPCG